MIKHYSSDSSIAINVVLKSGKSAHIAFVPLSNGGSVYSTNIEDVQKALESHYRFGSLFDLVGSDNVEEVPQAAEEGEGSAEASPATDLRTIVVHDIGEAKDYLADTLGVSRTRLRGEKSILDAATANGIVFEGL